MSHGCHDCIQPNTPSWTRYIAHERTPGGCITFTIMLRPDQCVCRCPECATHTITSGIGDIKGRVVSKRIYGLHQKSRCDPLPLDLFSSDSIPAVLAGELGKKKFATPKLPARRRTRRRTRFPNTFELWLQSWRENPSGLFLRWGWGLQPLPLLAYLSLNCLLWTRTTFNCTVSLCDRTSP